ncbi:MAG: transcriptional repressor [Clostridiales bacterium]|nr:transcriptional repressor [Clostridiales bacterium]
MQKQQIISMFRDKNFRVTPQRIAVYEYICNHKTHPDAFTIYENVLKEHPGFSKTTVYNSLKSLCESGFIIPVTIDETRIHYDANISLHGHFKCNCCQKIYDFDISALQSKGLEDFSVSTRNVYYSGICRSCKNKIN